MSERMRKQILRIVGNKQGDQAPSMADIILNFPYDYRTEYRDEVMEMTEAGILVRSWDESGLPHYSKPTETDQETPRFEMVPGPGAPQYTFDLGDNTQQLSLL